MSEKRGPYKKYKPAEMKRALELAKAHSLSKTAMITGVRRTTLNDHIRGTVFSWIDVFSLHLAEYRQK